nr:hypothetical protein [Tanacetum cinerariifolium]
MKVEWMTVDQSTRIDQVVQKFVVVEGMMEKEVDRMFGRLRWWLEVVMMEEALERFLKPPSLPFLLLRFIGGRKGSIIMWSVSGWLTICSSVGSRGGLTNLGGKFSRVFKEMSIPYIDVSSYSEDEGTESSATLPIPPSPDYVASLPNYVSAGPSKEDPSEDEEDEPLSTLVTPTPPTQTTPNFPTYIVQHGCTLSIRSPSPSPSDTIAKATAKAATLPPRKRFQMTLLHSVAIVEAITEATTPCRMSAGESSLTAYTHSVTGQLVQHIFLLLVARMVRHEREIHSLQDQMEELPLGMMDTMHQEGNILYACIETSQQDVDTLQATLGATREQISDLELRLDESEAKEDDLETRIRALEERFAPSGSS